MGDRLKSTFDGAMVGIISSILVELIASYWGGSPARSPQDIILTGLIAGAMVGWVTVDIIVNFGLFGGMMSGMIAIGMIAFSILPFALASATVNAQPLVLPMDDITNWALVWILVSGIVGLTYQKISLLLTPMPQVQTQRLQIQQVHVEK